MFKFLRSCSIYSLFLYLQVFVALICALITTPPTLFVITVFNRSKRRVPVFCKVNQVEDFQTADPERQMEFDGSVNLQGEEQIKKKWWRALYGTCCNSESKITEGERIVLLGPDESIFQLPYWFAFVGWGLAFGN